MEIGELFPGLFTESEIIFLDFKEIPKGIEEYKNIQLFFSKSLANGVDPRLAENRQKFNDHFLEMSKKRYLIGRYAEDRIEMLRGSHIAEEGRTFHLGIDIFSRDLEPVYAPCNGEVVDVGRQAGAHTYGYYLIFKPSQEGLNDYLFLGHLSKQLPKLGTVVKGQQIATLGDFTNGENGGWSRHLHLQLMNYLPEKGTQPKGYSTKEDLSKNLITFPDPAHFVFR